MTEHRNDDDNREEKEESFAALLDAYSPGLEAEINIGDKIRGKIISIGKDSVFVDTGSKMDGVVDKAELLDKDKKLELEEGDMLELYVVALADDEIRLSKAVSGVGGLQMLKEAYDKAVPVEGKISETCKGGLRVEILQRKAFCPISQVDINYVEDPSEFVGKTLNFLITTLEERGKNIVVSRRALLAQEQEKSRKAFYETLSVDSVLDGQVTRTMPYGIFVQLADGVEGMVHISELDWSKVAKPEELVHVGEAVRVKVIGIEPDKRPGMLKIGLSMKRLTEDPWDSADQHFHAGNKIIGKVTRCANFGAFVEVAPGIEGLVHISEMSYTKRIINPEDIVSAGETVSVLIKEVDMEKRRLSLSIRDAEGDPWVDVAEKYTIGQSLEAVLEKKEKFGYFINLEPGITGLLPKSKLGKSQRSSELEKLKEGDSIPVIIEAINIGDRKISLMPGNTEDEQNWQKFSGDTGPSMGSLGEKLQQAMSQKKTDD
ncbi:SSU ribosomal protein S1p [Olavius sp. associated proteobacterium Delta 1]|nr:SSU ribosomal protein S1p [Olavius sp. associated proteobacterium Delta 1]